MEKLKITALVLGVVGTNCYIISNRETKEAVIVDPADKAGRICEALEKEQIIPKAILLTHGHFDHILAVNDLLRTYQIPVYAGEAEQELLSNPDWNLSASMHHATTIEASNLVTDGEILELLGTRIKAIATPGHTAGGMCYYFMEDGMMFVGDTIFLESVGRTDFPTGNSRVLNQSIKEKLFVCDDGIRLYPGHGPETTIGYEKENNPFV